MANEVEEFLRKAAARRAQVEAQARAQASRPAGANRPQAKPAQPKVAPPKPTARLVPQDDLVMLQPVDAEVVNAELAEAGDRVSPSVNRNLRSSSLTGQHASQFGGHVGMADDDMDSHLRKTFDHQLGRLVQSSSRADAVDAAASRSSQDSASESHGSIVRMLKSPRSLRDAIVVSEILQRPEHLWK